MKAGERVRGRKREGWKEKARERRRREGREERSRGG